MTRRLTSCLRRWTSDELSARATPEEELGPPGDPESVARSICLRALNERARTRAELASLLSRRGVPADSAGAVLDRFVEVGLIDDVALADAMAIAAHRDRGLARRAVAVKLRRRGIEESVVQAAIEQIDDDSETTAAREVALRKLKSLRGLDTAVQARRLVSLLGRRGYPPAVAYRVVKDVLAGVGAAPDLEEPVD